MVGNNTFSGKLLHSNSTENLSNEISKTKRFPDVKLFEDYNEKKYGSYEKYRKARGKYYYNHDFTSGRLEFVAPTKILGITISKGFYKYHTGLNNEGFIETMKDIYWRYNLPENSLGEQIIKDEISIYGEKIPEIVTIPMNLLQNCIQ